MAFELLLDENLEHDVLYNLRNRNHDVEHVEFVTELGKGTRDDVVAEYSRETNRAIVSYDDDFRDSFAVSEYFGFIFVPDDTLSSGQIATILHEMSRHFDQQDLRGTHVLDTGWLSDGTRIEPTFLQAELSQPDRVRGDFLGFVQIPEKMLTGGIFARFPTLESMGTTRSKAKRKHAPGWCYRTTKNVRSTGSNTSW